MRAAAAAVMSVCDEARGDGVRGDAELPEFLGERLGEPLQARLDRGVVGLTAVAQGRAGRQRDDTAEPLLDHVLLAGLGHEERALEVHVHHGVPVGLGHPEDQVVAEDARVVDEDVGAPELVGDARHSGLHLAPSVTSTPTPRARPPAAGLLPPALQAASSRSSTLTANPSAASRRGGRADAARSTSHDGDTLSGRWGLLGRVGVHRGVLGGFPTLPTRASRPRFGTGREFPQCRPPSQVERPSRQASPASSAPSTVAGL